MIELLQGVIEYLFQAQVNGYDVVMAIDPITTSALVSAGSSLLGGLLSRRGNQRQQVEAPTGLDHQIEQLQDPNFFLGSLQQTVNNEQGAYNVNAGIASQGVDSPAIAAEQREAMESDRQNAIVEGLGQMEGQRMGMLNQLLGQRAQLNTQVSRSNAQLGQQHNQNNMDIMNEMIGGATGSVVQGLGAKVAQQNFDTMMDEMGQANQQTGWQGGQGFGSSQGSASMFDMMMNGNNSFANFG